MDGWRWYWMPRRTCRAGSVPARRDQMQCHVDTGVDALRNRCRASALMAERLEASEWRLRDGLVVAQCRADHAGTRTDLDGPSLLGRTGAVGRSRLPCNRLRSHPVCA